MSIRALRFDRIAEMLEFLAIFGAAIGGFAGMPPWVIAASAIALASLSYAENYKLYRRGQELGLTDVLVSTVSRSAFNAAMAAGGAYGVGWLLLIGQV